MPLPEDDRSYDLEAGASLRLVLDHDAINGEFGRMVELGREKWKSDCGGLASRV